MDNKKNIEIKNFFIFNSSYGAKENEEYKKILYYYPFGESTEIQIKNIGLVEGIVQFTETFRPSSYVSSLHTNKLRQLYFQPELNFWIVMTLSVPLVTKIKDSVSSNEYMEEDIQDNVYEAILSQAYYMYRLFWGTLEQTLVTGNADILRNRLDTFFNAYLKTVKLSNADILNLYGGIQYLPLDRQTFLKVQCFVNLLESSYGCIEEITFLYNEHVIWSGIEPNDMKVMYQYLIGMLLPANIETELQGGSMPRNSPFATLKRGRFITGPTNLKQAKTVGTVPRVYLFSNDCFKEHHLAVYRCLSATVCIFIKGDTNLTLELFKELDELINPRLSCVVAEIAEYCSKQIMPSITSGDTIPKFIYFNKINLAYKSTIHLDNKQTENSTCSKDSLKIMADMKDQNEFLGRAGESIVKTKNDYWVVGKNSNFREFYIVLQTKNANLIKISEEVKKLCDNELKGIFFHPF
ncbi:vacuolar fusion protein CCZ1 homolog [Sitophilus oryzae]|uniref:Vacuolar fusion protein CCZ1 homolog n=1 Tax=Sitophilus oryzae TaxID=7048 RepID=A0A6J2XX54_SITOR|nr:vacuolar fusion protein CCZ1 homolog [Sitophilus oryzae]XP_030756052.1 vacuolar fusion protein CCZ1 homolog [Sitophilus oryzae]